MMRIPALIGAIVIVSVLTALCVSSQSDVIEGDLHLRAMAALRSRGLQHLAVTIEGRDVRLGGIFRAEGDRKRALEGVRVYGVRTVEDNLRKVEQGDLWLRIQVSDEGDVTIRGWVDDPEGMESLRRAVETWFRSGHIDDDSSLTGIRFDSSLLDAAWAALPWLAELSPGLLEISSERLMLAGRTPRQDVVELAGPALRTTFEGPMEIEIQRDRNASGAESVDAIAIDLEPDSTTDAVAESEGPLILRACEARLDALLESEDLPFERWSPRLDPASTALLSRIAILLNRCPESRLRITGLADRESQDEVDRILGMERARSVEVWLSALGVAANRMSIEGSGRGAKRHGSRVVRAVELEIGGVGS